MSSSEDIIILSDGDAKVIFDNRYFPLMMTAWVGEPTMRLSQDYFETRQRIFFERGEKLGIKRGIIASEMSRMKAPPATVRKYMGEQGKAQDANPFFAGYCIVVSNALLRGVITALTWFTGKTEDVRGYFPNIGDAMAKASALLTEEGITHPTTDFSSYEVPRD